METHRYMQAHLRFHIANGNAANDCGVSINDVKNEPHRIRFLRQRASDPRATCTTVVNNKKIIIRQKTRDTLGETHRFTAPATRQT